MDASSCLIGSHLGWIYVGINIWCIYGYMLVCCKVMLSHIHFWWGFHWCSMQTCLFFYSGLLLHGVSAWISTVSFHFRALFLIFSLPGLRSRSQLRWFWWWSSSLEQIRRSGVGTHNHRGAYQLETGIHGEIRYISLVWLLLCDVSQIPIPIMLGWS